MEEICVWRKTGILAVSHPHIPNFLQNCFSLWRLVITTIYFSFPTLLHSTYKYVRGGCGQTLVQLLTQWSHPSSFSHNPTLTCTGLLHIPSQCVDFPFYFRKHAKPSSCTCWNSHWLQPSRGSTSPYSTNHSPLKNEATKIRSASHYVRLLHVPYISSHPTCHQNS